MEVGEGGAGEGLTWHLALDLYLIFYLKKAMASMSMNPLGELEAGSQKTEKADSAAPARFVKELWGSASADWIVEFSLLQYKLTQESPGDQRMQSLFYTVKQVLEDWPAIEEQLDHFNRTQFKNVHHGVNPRFQRPRKHGKDADVSHYVAAWVDIDFLGHESAVREQFFNTTIDLQKRGLGPSVTIESGRGLHAYWLFDYPVLVVQARSICAGIQDYFKISDVAHDPRRSLRMPGFLNLKNPKDPKLCQIFDATYARYPVERFQDFALENSFSRRA